MQRRGFVALLATILGWPASTPAAGAAPSRRPNLLFIVASVPADGTVPEVRPGGREITLTDAIRRFLDDAHDDQYRWAANGSILTGAHRQPGEVHEPQVNFAPNTEQPEAIDVDALLALIGEG